MAIHTWKPSFGTAQRKVYFKQESALTRDGSVLSEFAHDFANLGGDKRVTRKRQAIRYLRITNRTVHLTVSQDGER